MTLFIDAGTCPGSVADFCTAAAERAGAPVRLIRGREKDLYQQSSASFEEESEKKGGRAWLRSIAAEIAPADILVTGDADFAAQALPRATAVIHPDGFVYTPQSLNLIALERFQRRRARPLTRRAPELDTRFKEVLLSYLGSVSAR